MSIFRRNQPREQNIQLFTQSIADQSDEELIKAISKGIIQAIEALYDRYHQLLYSIAYRMVADHQVAEDLLQEAFLSIWQHANTYSTRTGSVKTWLCSIIHHDTIDYLRKVKRRAALSSTTLDVVDQEGYASETDAWDETWSNIQGAQVYKAIQTLSKEQRMVIELAYFGGWTHSEIAEGCQLPLGTVKARMRLGLQRLRQQLVKMGINEA